jgi:hypothetical protein
MTPDQPFGSFFHVTGSAEEAAHLAALRLDHLAPGRYVILARYAGSNATTSLDVSVAPGQVADVILPDPCK